MRPVVWMSDPSLHSLGEKIASGGGTPIAKAGTTVSSLEEFIRATRNERTISFVDAGTLPELARVGATLPSAIIGIATDTLASAVAWLQPYPWLSHVVSASTFDHPMASWHFENLIATFNADAKPRLLDWLGPEVAGRRIRLAKSNKRADRLERMGDFLDSKGVGSRTITQLRDSAEELLTNAFYDAPVSAGAFKDPISRTLEVTLPDNLACDLAYGCRDDLAIVRVKDPFGSLTRKRLTEVLMRCSRTDMGVEVDESMGGAGLGMWKVFSSASFVAISVVAHRHTEILVGVAKRAPGQRPFAFHLFFYDGAKPRSWTALNEDPVRAATLNNSVLLAVKAR
ncbi:MAG: hypothetical protein SFX73_36865 [Kofleriaceae bacterium]|nr:hypothetical protein [Kofleriaceae bacterium]